MVRCHLENLVCVEKDLCVVVGIEKKFLEVLQHVLVKTIILLHMVVKSLIRVIEILSPTGRSVFTGRSGFRHPSVVPQSAGVA